MRSENLVFEVAEGNHDDSDVVKTPAQQRVFEDVFDSHGAHLVDVFDVVFDRGVVLVVVDCFPHAGNYVLVAHFVKDAIAAQHDEVVFLLYLETLYFWVVNHHVWIALQSCYFCFRVSKRASN